MGQVKVGDSLYGRDGKLTKVIGVSAIRPSPKAYQLTFDDGVSIKAGADHQWLAYHTLDRRKEPRPARVVTTEEIANSINQGDRKTWALPLTKPIEYPVVDLPIHPYTLGVWLGDGHKYAADITHHVDDKEIIERCCTLDGITAASKPDNGRAHVLRTSLGDKEYRKRYRKLGILCRETGKSNKHIPEIYKRASVEQRFELLAGLLDTDGCALKKPGAIELCFCNQRLAQDSLELIRSLGFKAKIKASDSKLYGVVKSTRYRIRFTATR
jgi:replicative DNA helicase